MPAYLVTSVEVFDLPTFRAEYSTRGSAAVAQYGGRFLVEGGRPEPIEGNWLPRRMAIVEFESAEAARRFYDSPEYREARRHRRDIANFNMILVEPPEG